jgi:hypothetical protein
MDARAEAIPTSCWMKVEVEAAPLAQILGARLLHRPYFPFGRRAGMFGLVAFLLNASSLPELVGGEFVIHLVFADLPDHTIAALRKGTLGVAQTVASTTFLLGTVTFVTAMMRHEIPRVPLVLYAMSALPVSLQAFVPEAALDLGLVPMAAGAGWLAV